MITQDNKVRPVVWIVSQHENAAYIEWGLGELKIALSVFSQKF